MAEETRKGPSERSRSAKAAQGGDQRASGTSESDTTEQARAQNPNEAAAFDADQLDASIRAREQEDRGEVF